MNNNNNDNLFINTILSNLFSYFGSLGLFNDRFIDLKINYSEILSSNIGEKIKFYLDNPKIRELINIIFYIKFYLLEETINEITFINDVNTNCVLFINMDLELDNESNHDDIINLANKYSELIKDIFFKDCLNESDSKQYKKINFKVIYDLQRKSITLEKSSEQDEDNEIDASGETVIDVEADLSEASDAEGDHEDGQARLASNGWGDGEVPGQISDLNNEDREIEASLRDWLAEPPTSLNRVNEPNDGQPPDYSGDLNNEDREIEASLRDWLAEPPSSLNRVVDPSDGQPPDFSGDLNNDESSPMGSEASDQQTQSQSEEASDRDRDRNDVRGGSGERGSSKPLSKFSQESHQSVQRASLVLRAKLQGLLQAETLTRDPPGRRGKIVSNRLARIQINEQKLFAPKRFKKHFDTVVHILLDSSMSMGGQKIALANEACYSLALALYPVRGILIGASHFPARGPENPAVAELFLRYGQRPGANFYVKAYGGTPLLKALDETIDLVSQQKSERKLIVVISDGRPNKWDDNATNKAQKKMIEIYGIGIIDNSVLNLFPGRALVINNLNQFAPALFNLVKKALIN